MYFCCSLEGTRTLLMHPLSKAVALWALITGIILIAVINSVSARDPTSVFFDPKTGYQPSYSDFRRRQAIDFISGHNATESLEHPRVEKKEQTLCVGIPSIGRGGAQYMIATIGSLLEGLTPEERSDMFLVVFIAHTDPSTHPLYGEPWLHQLTDHVLTYNLDEREMQVVRTMEDEGVHSRPKDSTIIPTCYPSARSSTRHTLLFLRTIRSLWMDGFTGQSSRFVRQNIRRR